MYEGTQRLQRVKKISAADSTCKNIQRSTRLYLNRFSPTVSVEKMEDQTSIPLKPMRHQSSYENMNTVHFAGDCDHQYDELHGHNRKNSPNVAPGQSDYKNKQARARGLRRKESEPANVSADSCDGSHQSAPSKVFRILAFAGFLIALVVFIAVILLALGAHSPSSCRECKNQSELGSGKASASTEELFQVIKELSSNISELYAVVKSKDEIISRLQTQDGELTDKIADLDRKTRHQAIVVSNSSDNLNSIAGPQGPRGIPGANGPKGEDGLDGKTGQRGPGNMTSCQYMTRASAPVKANSSVTITEEPGYKILGVTCSTIGMLEYNFKSEINATTNVREHECECKGQNSDTGKCVIHYWMCPLTFY